MFGKSRGVRCELLILNIACALLAESLYSAFLEASFQTAGIDAKNNKSRDDNVRQDSRHFVGLLGLADRSLRFRIGDYVDRIGVDYRFSSQQSHWQLLIGITESVLSIAFNARDSFDQSSNEYVSSISKFLLNLLSLNTNKSTLMLNTKTSAFPSVCKDELRYYPF